MFKRILLLSTLCLSLMACDKEIEKTDPNISDKKG